MSDLFLMEGGTYTLTSNQKYGSWLHTFFILFTNFFCMWVIRMFKIYSLNNFQVYSRVPLTVVMTVTTHLIPRSSSHDWSPVPSDQPLRLPTPCDLPFYSFYESILLLSMYKWDDTVYVLLWLISLSIMPSKFIHVAANIRISFCFIIGYYYIIYIYIYIYFIFFYPFIWPTGRLFACFVYGK